MVTAWIPFQQITDTNGALQFAAGSHLGGYIDRPTEKEDADVEFFNRYVADSTYQVWNEKHLFIVKEILKISIDLII